VHRVRRSRCRSSAATGVRRAACGLCAPVLVVGLIVTAPRVAAAVAAVSGCDPYVNGTVVPVPCSSASGSDGAAGLPGSGGTGVTFTCSTVSLDQAQAQNLGLAWPPPDGESWALLDCLGGAVGSGPQAVLVDAVTGLPQLTPQQLMVRALGELQVPSLGPQTAPPAGRDGLVGLPEWFWIPAPAWHPVSVTVSAGPVWARVTATPAGLSFDPGSGISPVSCAGPGTPYNPASPAEAQQTDCSYTYAQSSAGLAGNVYQASVTVTWQVTWRGSGGAGGVLATALSVPLGFSIPVAQGEALVTSP
jgi:hypothetical protein